LRAGRRPSRQGDAGGAGRSDRPGWNRRRNQGPHRPWRAYGHYLTDRYEMTSKDNSPARPPLGATAGEDGVTFAVYSETAEKLWVCLFDDQDEQTDRVELARGEGNVWSAHVAGLGANASYGLRADGRYDPAQGYYFDPDKLLVDPYARRIDRTFVRSPKLRLPRGESVDTASVVPKALVQEPVRAPEWRHDTDRPHLIYELNIRPFTMRHPSVQGPLRGTVAGMTT